MKLTIEHFGVKDIVTIGDDGHFRNVGGKSFGTLNEGVRVTGLLHEPTKPNMRDNKSEIQAYLDYLEIAYPYSATKKQLLALIG